MLSGAPGSNLGGTLGSGPGATGTATVTGAGSTWTNISPVSVGHYGTGILNIENGGVVTVGGNLSINSLSTLGILLASLDDPLLDVAGNATLSGTLSVDLAEGFALSAGDLFTLIDMTDISKTVSGTFMGLAEGDSVANFGGLDLLISYAGGDGNDVTLFTALLGDANGNGVVSMGDFTTVQGNYGNTGEPGILGDANYDGTVSAGDFTTIQSNYGNGAPSEPAAIPEPTTLALFLLSALALLRGRRKA